MMDGAEHIRRSSIEVRGMALCLQANLFSLKVEDARRRGMAVESHDIALGGVAPESLLRDHLLSEEAGSHYSDLELRLRMHELWGQYCVLQWFFEIPLTDGAREVSGWAVEAEARCETVLEFKEAEIAAMLWRLKFEQRRRTDRNVAEGKEYARHRLLAQRIPMTVFGTAVESCGNEDLLVSSCEHAGMLAVVRWIRDAALQWGQEGLMDVADEPFSS